MSAINYLVAIITLYTPIVTLPLGLLTQPQSDLKIRSASLPERVVFQDFDPPGKGEPKKTSGAGSRGGGCPPDEQPIRPLLPKQNYGLTFKERPSIFIDLPKTSAHKVALVFQDETGASYERAFLPLPARGGIVSFTLPDEKPPLAVGKRYQWSLVVVCGKTVQPDDPVVSGWVKRMAQIPELESLRQKSDVQRAVWYGANGYWYDMVGAMVQAVRSHPEDTKVNALWQDLLKSTGLGAIASVPLR